MKNFATHIDDSSDLLAEKVTGQMAKPGFAIDSYFYRSNVAYQTELERIIYRSWLYAGHVSQIRQTGDFFLFELGDDSVIISRDDKGIVGAMHNVCRHRGSRVCAEKSGNRKAFVCPYHGWVYNTDGTLKQARDMEFVRGFSCENYRLKQVRVDVFQGLIFINCDDQADDFRAPLQKINVQLGAYGLESARIADSRVYQIDANWKLCLENYLECYHCATAHRSYAKSHTSKELEHKVEGLNEAMRSTSDAVTGVEGISEGFNDCYDRAGAFGCCVFHGRYALYAGYQTGSEDGQPVAPLMGKMQGYDGGASDFQMGPLSFMLNYPDYCVLYRFIPRGINKTDMELVWFVRGNAVEGVDYDKEKVTWLWHKTSLEDEKIINANSAGVKSHFFEPGPYHSEHEINCIEFISWYLECLGEPAT